jgi:xanthine dehydrogenase accessory factor
MKAKGLSELRICVRGGGDIASGVCWRLRRCGFRVVILEAAQPMAVRRRVAFCEAVYDGRAEVQGMEAVRIDRAGQAESVCEQGRIPVLVDPLFESRAVLRPDVIVDAILAKRNTGTSIRDAPLVIALGPGFEVGRDAHFIVETNRGHNLGRLLTSGSAEPNTGVPGPVLGITSDRVLRSPADGTWRASKDIGDPADPGDVIGSVSGLAVRAAVGGVVRGLVRPGIRVTKGLKIGDIDPRGDPEYCATISEKALAVAGGVIEGILRVYLAPFTSDGLVRKSSPR